MWRNWKRTGFTDAAIIAGALVLTCTEANAAPPAQANKPPKPVIVVNPEPIPVTGDVNATVVGTVPVLVENTAPLAVEGSVTVANVGPIPVEGNVTADVSGTVEVQDFNTQMSAVRAEIVAVRQAVENLEQAPWTTCWFARRFDVGDVLSGTSHKYVPVSLCNHSVSTAIITAENDQMEVEFYPGDCGVGNPILYLGSTDQTWATNNVFNFPDPIPVGCVLVRCHNNSQNCEVGLSLIGSQP